MGMNSTEGQPFDGEDPIELDADRPGFDRPGFDRLDAALAAAFRAGLEPDDGQTRRVIARLPLIQAQARRNHRRRLVLASGIAVVAVTAAAALVATLPPTTGASTVTPADRLSPPPATSTVKPFVLRPTVLLPPSAITAFGDARLTGNEADELGGQPLVAGVCVDAALPVANPDNGYIRGWKLAGSAAKAPSVLIEKVWRWADPESAADLFQLLEAQVAGCSSGPGLEGRGVTRRLDPPQELSRADSVLVTTASDGQGNHSVQVVMLAGQVVVQLDAVFPDIGKNQKSTTTLAEWLLTPTAQAALTRALDVTEAAAR
jgi:hypothetical protein